MAEETTYEDLGRAFVRALAASRAVGHVSPAGLADYVPEGDEAASVVVDAFASTRLDSRAKPAERRVDEWLMTSPLAQAETMRAAEHAGFIADAVTW